MIGTLDRGLSLQGTPGTVQYEGRASEKHCTGRRKGEGSLSAVVGITVYPLAELECQFMSQANEGKNALSLHYMLLCNKITYS